MSGAAAPAALAPHEAPSRAARRYTGRFAPSPTGPLHAGSLVAALASWLDARASQGAQPGRWLVRLEDVDTPRCVPGADQVILQQLARCGLLPDEAPTWQSQRSSLYEKALQQLIAQGDAYPCACSRKDIEQAHAALGHARERHTPWPYPGTCRTGLGGKPARAWRFQTVKNLQKYPSKTTPDHTDKARAAHFSIANTTLTWHDRRGGWQHQDVAQDVGDFVLRRADGLWAYQLAVVVDDAQQGVTHVVRGEDLADNTPRQLLLQRALGVPAPDYLHTPLVLAGNGEKLSKQNGAAPVDLSDPVTALARAAGALGLPQPQALPTMTVAEALAFWISAWGRIYNLAP